PEGWSVEEAKSQLDVLRGFSYKGKGLVGSLDEGVPMHNLNSVLEGGGYKYAGLKFYSEEFKEKFAIQEGDVLVANTEQGHNHLLIGYGA
ncbi:restriction endonuclease subunit S, partial [Vibrio parahaemolyticus]|nr:restriction endonuclease subunit S [Vibrio parahaemolyticus]